MAHQLKGYKFILFTPVYHDDKFVWNTEKEIVIHARSENGAKKKIESKLEKGKEERVNHLGFPIKSTKELAKSSNSFNF